MIPSVVFVKLDRLRTNVRAAGSPEKSGDVYYIYTTFTGNNATLRSYFCDEGTDWLVMKSTADLDGFDQESAQWYVYAL